MRYDYPGGYFTSAEVTPKTRGESLGCKTNDLKLRRAYSMKDLIESCFTNFSI